MGDTYLPGTTNNPGDTFHTNVAPDTGIVYLLSGVPLDMTQKNQLWFNNKTEQHDYFVNHFDVRMMKGTYQKKQNIIRFDANAEQLNNYNYVMYQNSQYGTKWFYAFITDIEYRSSNSTYVSFKIDAFQTYFLDVDYKWTYVKAMHQKEWRTSDGGTGYTVPLERNQDEGLDYGKEYDIVKQIQLTPENNPNIKWIVITATDQFEPTSGDNTGKNASNGTLIGGVPVPYYMYCMPIDLNNPTNDGVKVTFTNGLGQDFFEGDQASTADKNIPHTISSLKEFQYAISKYAKFAGKVQSINIMDAPPFPVTGKFPTYSSSEQNIATVGAKAGSVTVPVGQDKITYNYYLRMIRVYGTYGRLNMRYDLGNVYKYFPYTSPYSKLMNSPYTMIEITDFKGHSLSIKPEYLNTSKLVIDMYTSLSWETKIGYSVKNYNIGKEPYGGAEGQVNGEINWLHTIFDNVSGDIPMLTEQSAIFMQSHKNAMLAEKTNLAETNRTKTAIINQTALTNAIGHGLTGMANGMAGGMGAGIPGMVAGAALGGINAVAGDAMKYMNESYANNLRNQTSERNLARSQMAKLEDISNMPPQISGQGNNTIFENENEISGVYVIFKQIKPEYRKKIQDYFHMFGYLCNELVDLTNKKPMTSRKYWNYIETQHINVSGRGPQPLIDELEAVFDKGVTLWHVTNGVEVGDYSKENSEV